MKYNGEYTPEEEKALQLAVEAANNALAKAYQEGDPHRFHVSFIELGGSENGASDPFYAIGATHEAEGS